MTREQILEMLENAVLGILMAVLDRLVFSVLLISCGLLAMIAPHAIFDSLKDAFERTRRA